MLFTRSCARLRGLSRLSTGERVQIVQRALSDPCPTYPPWTNFTHCERNAEEEEDAINREGKQAAERRHERAQIESARATLASLPVQRHTPWPGWALWCLLLRWSCLWAAIAIASVSRLRKRKVNRQASSEHAKAAAARRSLQPQTTAAAAAEAAARTSRIVDVDSDAFNRLYAACLLATSFDAACSQLISDHSGSALRTLQQRVSVCVCNQYNCNY